MTSATRVMHRTADGWGLREDLMQCFAKVRILAVGPRAQGAIRSAGLHEEWSPDSENCTEVLNLSRPDIVHEIHRGYLEAGSDIIQTNSFGGSPITLAEFEGLEDKAIEINRRAGELAREAIEKFGPLAPRRIETRPGAMFTMIMGTK